jgi:hypothetical protein
MAEFGLALVISGIITAIGAVLAFGAGDPDVSLRGFLAAAAALIGLGAAACMTPVLPATLPRVARANAEPKRLSGPPPLPASWWWFWLIVVSYAILVAASAVFYGTPKNLPGIALGAPALLQMERGAAGLAVVAAVSIFAYLTRLGHLPTQFGNVGYEALESRQEEGESRQREADRVTAEALVAMASGLSTLRDWIVEARSAVPDLPQLDGGDDPDAEA